jgi:hypothetical protein
MKTNIRKEHHCFSFIQRRTVILFLGMFISLGYKSQSYSQLIFDNRESQYFGAYNLTTIHKSLYLFEDKHVLDTLFRENNFIKKAGGFGYRMAKLLLLDAQIDCFVALSQHEVFGHGARYREFGYKGNSFNLNLYPPFGDGSGFAQRGILQAGYKSPTLQENIVMSIGGVDAEILLGNNITNQMLLDDTLHYRQGLLYLISQNNLLLYLWRTRYTSPANIKPGNDMISYINEINYLYPTSAGKKYDLNTLSDQGLISLANPLQIYSAFSILYSYGIRGKKQLKKIPMIKLGNVRYLPALNYSFTPFGSQYHFINYIRYKQILLNADFNMGEQTFTKFYGVSLKGYNIVNKKRITLNFHLDVWNQPELELTNYSQPTTLNKTGESFKVDIMFRPFIRQNKLGIFVQTGYKTKGYVSGEVLAESFILRYGIGLHL